MKNTTIIKTSLKKANFDIFTTGINTMTKFKKDIFRVDYYDCNKKSYDFPSYAKAKKIIVYKINNNFGNLCVANWD